MYNDGFVLSIISNGRSNREYSKDGKSIVHLPFGTEYAVRIKSKVSTRCKADVFIDGTSISDIGSFVISPYGTMDIERFLGADMSKGRKFKFETLHHPGVQDPNSCENGLVEVYIYREKLPAYTVTYTTTYDPYQFGWQNMNTSGSILYHSCNRSAKGMQECSLNYCSTQEGATVEGSKSNQHFVSVSGFETESTPIVLRVKIVGVDSIQRTDSYIEYCSRCGKRRDFKDNYCGKCGYKLNNK